MSNVVQFLETLARNPQPLSYDDFVAAVMRANLDPVTTTALVQRDVAALKRQLGALDAAFCVIFPADNEEPKEEEVPQEDGGEVPQHQEPESRAA